MIIISCPNCNKPIEPTHAYKIQDGVAAHAECSNPVALEGGGKTITIVGGREGGARWDGIKQED